MDEKLSSPMDEKLSPIEAKMSSEPPEIRPLKSEVIRMKNGQISKYFVATHSFRYSGPFIISKQAIPQEASGTVKKSLFSMLEEKRQRTIYKLNCIMKKRRFKRGIVRKLPRHGSLNLDTTNFQQTVTDGDDVCLALGSDSSSKYRRRKRFRRKRGQFEVRGHCRIISRESFYVDIKDCEVLVDIFKSVPSGFEDQATKRWTFPLCVHDELILLIKQLKPTVRIIPIPLEVLQIFKRSKEMLISEYDLSRMDQVLVKALLPFQKEGLYFGIQHDGKILLADDMGLGKTIQAIAIANYFMEDWPLLVISPSSVKYSWLDSFHRWLPSLDASEINVINSSKDQISSHKVVIVSYDLVRKFQSDITKGGFKSVIFDESHYLKNPEALRTRAAQAVIKNMKRVLMLSGTPALSRPVELYVQLSSLCPQYFNSYHQYGMRYCKGRDFHGASNTTELRLLLEDLVMIRRLKSEVISQLPSKSRQRIILDPSLIDKSKSLRQLGQELQNIENVNEIKRNNITMKYFLETGIAKIPAVCHYISELLESHKKFLCFAHHQEVIKGICRLIENEKIDFIRIDGAVPAEQRKKLCDHFQSNDGCKVAVLSITAANVGITLTAASLVVFAELFWNPGSLIQAEDRAHRIGQVNSIVVQYLVAKDTADDILWRLIQLKLTTLKKVGLSEENFKSTDEILMSDRSVLGDAIGDLEQHEVAEEKGIAAKGVEQYYKHVQPEELPEIIELDNNDLSNNRVEELPGIIEIGDNDLTRKPVKKELPEIIELDDEDLPGERVKELPEIIELDKKDLSNNRVEELPGVIEFGDNDLTRKCVKKELPEIIELDDEDLPWEHIKEILSQIKELDNKDLSNNRVVELPGIIEIGDNDFTRKCVKEELPEIIELDD